MKTAPLYFTLFSLLLSACSAPVPVTKRDGSKPPVMPADSSTVQSATPLPLAPATPAKPAEMAPLENEMLAEINKMRSDPAGYIPYIKDYLLYYEREGFDNIGEEEATARELVTQLQGLKPLPPLQSHKALYELARLHGEDLKHKGTLMGNPHIGTDRSTFEDRLHKHTNIMEGAENIGYYHPSVRYQLASLLIDSGTPDRTHRHALLDRQWKYAGCYFAGTIGEEANTWILELGSEEKAVELPVSVMPDMQEVVQKEVDAAIYMSDEERMMIKEINLLRAAPKAYVPIVEQYIQDVGDGKIWVMTTKEDEIKTAQGLIAELQQMAPLRLMRPHQKLYEVAKAHGKFLQKKGNIDQVNPHQGKGGTQPGARITKATGLSVGGENFGSGKPDVRSAVLDLLVDSGIPGQGHRKTLLDPAWEFVACYKVGDIAASGGTNVPNCWLQNFGK